MKVGIAGLGIMGKNHLRVLSTLDDVNEILVYDAVDVELPRNSSISRVSKFDDLISAGLDYVVLSLPTSLHLDYGRRLASSGVPTLLEKPVAQNLAQALEIQQEFLRAETLCAIGHVERFNPAISLLKREIHAGTIGQPLLYSTTRVGPYSGRIRDVGVVLDLATHDFDIVHYVSGSTYSQMKSLLGKPLLKAHEDIFVGVGELSGGAIVQHSVNWVTPRKVREVSVLGSKGMLVANALRVELRLYKNGDEQSEWPQYQNLRGVSEGEEVKFVVPAREPLRLEHLAMSEELAKPGSTDICRIGEAINTMRVAEELITAP